VNVGYEVYRIKTQVTEQGGKVEKGFYVDKRNKLDRSKRWEQLDEDLKTDELCKITIAKCNETVASVELMVKNFGAQMDVKVIVQGIQAALDKGIRQPLSLAA
jgi:type I site-specific restriction endonuclease